jgi:nucleotide-binding universal stress UspA family protein
VHVKPRPELGHEAWDAWDGALDRRLGELFQRLVVALRGAAPLPLAAAGTGGGRRDVTIGTAILVGDAAEELVDYAARVGADLVAVGTHGGRGGRLLAGSVVGELVRRAAVELPDCSVLLAPAE